jgi:hypothetical protein
MKKFLVAILAFLYISSSTGATVYMHYCMGRLAGAGLEHHSSKTCDKCGMEKAGQKGKGCCKDEHKFFKTQTDQDASITICHLQHPVAIALPVFFFEIPAAPVTNLATENPISHAPPPISSVAVYIRNCVFLI